MIYISGTKHTLWTDKPIKSLGIYFGNNNEESQKLNWENKIEKMNKLVRAWGKGNLSILGKIVIPSCF
jgi:hypothetical protein